MVGGLQAEASERSGRAQVLGRPLCGRAGSQGPSATVPASALHKGCHCPNQWRLGLPSVGPVSSPLVSWAG